MGDARGSAICTLSTEGCGEVKHLCVGIAQMSHMKFASVDRSSVF